jgi:hypothetical protein
VLGEEPGSVAAGTLEVLGAVVPEEPFVVVAPLESAGVAPVVVPPPAVEAPEFEAPEFEAVEVEAAEAGPAPAALPAADGSAPLALDLVGVEVEPAPVELTGVLDGAEAGLPSGVVVTVGGMPVAVPPPLARARTPGSGTADANRLWRVFATGPGRGIGLSLWLELAATVAMAAAVRILAIMPVALSPPTDSPTAASPVAAATNGVPVAIAAVPAPAPAIPPAVAAEMAPAPPMPLATVAPLTTALPPQAPATTAPPPHAPTPAATAPPECRAEPRIQRLSSPVSATGRISASAAR